MTIEKVVKEIEGHIIEKIWKEEKEKGKEEVVVDKLIVVIELEEKNLQIMKGRREKGKEQEKINKCKR